MLQSEANSRQVSIGVPAYYQPLLLSSIGVATFRPC